MCLFFNFWMIKCTIMFCLMHLCVLLFKNWKINTLSSKLRKLSSLGERTKFLYFLRKLCFFQFFNDKIHNYVLFAIIVHFNIQKLKNKQTFIQTEKAKSSHFDRTRGDKNQIFPTLVFFDELFDKFFHWFVFDGFFWRRF